MKVVRIADTLNLERFQASEGCVQAIEGRPGVIATGPAQEFAFDAAANLLPL